MNNEIQDYLNNSETFAEFWMNAEAALYEHYKEIKAQEEVLTDEVKDYAREIWDEHINSRMPF